MDNKVATMAEVDKRLKYFPYMVLVEDRPAAFMIVSFASPLATILDATAAQDEPGDASALIQPGTELQDYSLLIKHTKGFIHLPSSRAKLMQKSGETYASKKGMK